MILTRETYDFDDSKLVQHCLNRICNISQSCKTFFVIKREVIKDILLHKQIVYPLAWTKSILPFKVVKRVIIIWKRMSYLLKYIANFATWQEFQSIVYQNTLIRMSLLRGLSSKMCFVNTWWYFHWCVGICNVSNIGPN